MLTANGNRAALCLCLFCWRSGDWLRNSLNSKRMKDSSMRKCFYFGNPKIHLRHMWHDGKHSKNFEKKKLILALKRIEGTTACLLHSFKLYLPMNGSKSCGSKCFPLFFYMLTILVLSVIYIGNCLEIFYPGKESFRILSDHF